MPDVDLLGRPIAAPPARSPARSPPGPAPPPPADTVRVTFAGLPDGVAIEIVVNGRVIAAVGAVRQGTTDE